MATPGKPRQSGIPGPGRVSSIPTPGRSRSCSSVYQNTAPSIDANDISRAFADAIKANDPAQHRAKVLTSSLSTSSLSPKSASVAPSGRRSVVGRPSSAASTSSALGASTRAGAKTPVSARAPSRPPSRHSDIHGKTRPFEVGGNVRIESLGFEGVLRFLGEIDGKPGQWAGVELEGGFVGKGKNNGSVNGKQYFSCPLNCGVFVAVSKLSPPTVGPGATQYRPPSVASSRNGRTTPAMSGRVTPSFSASFSTARTPSASFANGRAPSLANGRITPSAGGRNTPSISTGRLSAIHTPSLKPRASVSGAKDLTLTDKITVGSRASKYITMTAKDLNSRDNSSSSSQSYMPSSPGPPPSPQPSRLTASPTRAPGSPFSTPKPLTASKFTSGLSFGKGRPSGSTPRARVPSGVAMPPPASPFSKTRQIASDDDNDNDNEPRTEGPLFGNPKDLYSRPGSSASVRSVSNDETPLVGRLQSRLDALEYENERLRATTKNIEDATVYQIQLEELRNEHKEAISQISQLQHELAESKALATAQQGDMFALKSNAEKLGNELEEVRRQDQEAIAKLRDELTTATAEVQQLQQACGDKQALCAEMEGSIHSKNTEMEGFKSRLASTLNELEEERRELGSQIDELRIAGQETIALYEERMSEVEGQRYDLECRLNALVEKASMQAEAFPSQSRTSETATEIDNETLRDQVVHLQKKIAMMEDIIEDHRGNAEKEEVVLRERMKRLKEKEESMKKELNEGRKEVERMSRSEASARNRVEEIEEALRESTFALENARAEIEALRAELANLDSLIEGSSDSDLSTRVAEFTRHISVEREQNENEIAQLKLLLQEARVKLTLSPNDPHQLAALHGEKEEISSKLARTKQELDERDREIRELKKRLRDTPIINGPDSAKGLSPTSSKSDIPSVGKEEVTGLKHIVQELQKENSTALNRIKMLESENQLLRSETEQLRQEVRLLEDNLDNSLLNEEEGLDKDNITGGPSLPDDVSSLQKRLKEQALELEQLRKKLSDLEMKHARTIHDLNKEISELEALVESKIYREDELEQEIERLKDKIARHKKSSKTSTEATERHRLSTASSSTGSSELTMNEPLVCEICERPGHDIFNCNLLKDDVEVKAVERRPELYCDDCETFGHTAAHCPHSQDVF